MFGINFGSGKFGSFLNDFTSGLQESGKRKVIMNIGTGVAIGFVLASLLRR
jgi:hypothetical protein